MSLYIKKYTVKVLIFYPYITVALCTVNTKKTKCLYIIRIKRYNASKTSYRSEKRAINNTPTESIEIPDLEWAGLYGPGFESGISHNDPEMNISGKRGQPTFEANNRSRRK